MSPCCNAEPMGREIRDVYDGVLFWTCTTCGSAWNRWPTNHYRHGQAQAFVDLVNAGSFDYEEWEQ